MVTNCSFVNNDQLDYNMNMSHIINSIPITLFDGENLDTKH